MNPSSTAVSLFSPPIRSAIPLAATSQLHSIATNKHYLSHFIRILKMGPKLVTSLFFVALLLHLVTASFVTQQNLQQNITRADDGPGIEDPEAENHDSQDQHSPSHAIFLAVPLTLFW